MLIIKSNNLTEAKYKLGLNEMKILMIIFYKINIENNNTIRLTAKQIKDILGIKGNSFYAEMKKIVRNIMKNILEFKNYDNNFLQINFLSSAEYKGGVVEISVDKKLMPHITNLKNNFTSYDIEEILSFKSKYSIRLYELLLQYKKLTKRIFLIEDFRKILGLNNNQYINYSDFKKRIILQAQKEINNSTSISFEYEEIKEGKKVIGVQFNIKTNNNNKQTNKINKVSETNTTYSNINKIEVKKNKKAVEPITKQNKENKSEIEVLLNKNTNLSEKVINNIIENYKENEIKHTLEKALENKNKVDNFDAYFISALKNKYFEETEYEKQLKEKKEQKKNQEEKRNKIKEEVEQVYNDYRKKIENKLNEIVSIENEEIKELRKEFIDTRVKDNVFLEREYNVNGFSKIIEATFKKYVLCNTNYFENEDFITVLKNNNQELLKRIETEKLGILNPNDLLYMIKNNKKIYLI